MKKYIGISIGSLLVICAVLFVSCKKKKEAAKDASPTAVTCNGTNASYNSNIKAIITANCVGCHGSYNSYAGLQSSLTDGSFARVVLTEKSMPRGNTLSADNLSVLQCWKERGYPEN
jgi:uncharacterized membrane protein